MKKLLLTILFTLVLGGGAFGEIIKFECDNPKFSIQEMTLDKNNKTLSSYTRYNDQYFNDVVKKRSGNTPQENNVKFKIKSINNEMLTYKAGSYLIDFYYNSNGNVVYKNDILHKCKSINFAEQKKQEMMFTINDKREQCEAIGFKPETEKFADCVLRLVELDIKKQQQTQVTVAQNNGNDALVEQLQRQNDIQSSQALINLGQQLLQPKQFNSNIYMPQTQRCTVSGFGVTSVVRCY